MPRGNAPSSDPSRPRPRPRPRPPADTDISDPPGFNFEDALELTSTVHSPLGALGGRSTTKTPTADPTSRQLESRLVQLEKQLASLNSAASAGAADPKAGGDPPSLHQVCIYHSLQSAAPARLSEAPDPSADGSGRDTTCGDKAGYMILGTAVLLLQVVVAVGMAFGVQFTACETRDDCAGDGYFCMTTNR